MLPDIKQAAYLLNTSSFKW